MFISVFTRAPLPIRSQINLHNALPNYLFKIHFNNILSLMLQLSIRSAGFPTSTDHKSLLPHTCKLPAYLNILHFITRILSHAEQKPLDSALDLCSTSNHLSPPPSHAAISPPHPVLEHPQPIFCPQDDTRSFTATLEKAKIIIQHIFIFRPTFCDSKLQHFVTANCNIL